MDPILKARIRDYDSILSGLDNLVALEAVRELGIFELLLAGARSSQQLAETVGASPKRLGPFLDLVVHLGFLRKEGEQYALVAGDEELFDPEGPCAGRLGVGSLSNFLRRRGSAVDVLRNDEAVKAAATGGSVGEEKRNSFLAHAHSRSGEVAAEVASLIARPEVQRIADLGCGPGTYTVALLRACPEATAVMVDREETQSFVRSLLAERGLEDRASFVGADYLEDDFGTDFDLVLISENIHNLGEEDNQRLIQRVADRLAPGGRVVVKDRSIETDRSGPVDALQFAVALAIFADQGGVYSADEVMGWTLAAGLSFEATLKLQQVRGAYLVVARKA